MRDMRGTTRKMHELANTPSRRSALPRTPVQVTHAAERDPVRQRLDGTFDRVAAAKSGPGGHTEQRKLTELQRDLDIRRSVVKEASFSGRDDIVQLQVSGSGIRRAVKPEASRMGVRWAEVEMHRPASSPQLDAHLRSSNLHQGSAVLHSSLDLGQLERGERPLVRNSEVSVHTLMGRQPSARSPEPQERYGRADAAAKSPTQALLGRHTQRQGGRGSPRKPSRLHLEDPSESPDRGPRRGRSQSPRKKPILAQLDVENLEYGVGPDGYPETPNRAALGDVTPSRNWQVRGF